MYREALKHLVHTLHLKQRTGTVVHCGRTISKDGNIKVTRKVDRMSIDLAGRTLESATHERRNHWIPTRVGTVVLVGTAVAI